MIYTYVPTTRPHRRERGGIGLNSDSNEKNRLSVVKTDRVASHSFLKTFIDFFYRFFLLARTFVRVRSARSDVRLLIVVIPNASVTALLNNSIRRPSPETRMFSATLSVGGGGRKGPRGA